MKKPNLAILGATGAVGAEFITLIEERNFPYENLKLLASARSAGTELTVNGKTYVVEEAKPESFDGIDIALFAGGSISKTLAPEAAKRGAIVIDNSSAFRMDPEVPLVVPEVNPEDILKHKGIIANPNCSTMQAMVALKPLYDKYGIKRIVYSTYQAVSGAGIQGILDLQEGTTKKFPYPILGNVIPHIDVFLDNGYTKEEIKMIEETKKILHDDNLRITATTVRVPVLNAHSESINVELNSEFELENVIDLFNSSKGIIVHDDVENLKYPTPLELSGKDEVFVGRIRRDFSLDNGLNLWVVADNIRKGAALNAIQIAEILINEK